MLTQFQDYLTFENIYIFSSFGVMPLWLMLIFIPNSRFNNLTLAGTFTNGFNAVMGLITASGNISSSGTGSFSDGRFTGKVGIGTTAPHLPLHVEGNTRIEGNFIVGNCAPTNNPAADIHIKSSGTDAKLRIEDLDDDNLAYDILVNSGSGFTITETTDATSRTINATTTTIF